MKWNLRMAAAQRGIWKASEMQRLLAERGLEDGVPLTPHTYADLPLRSAEPSARLQAATSAGTAERAHGTVWHRVERL